MSVQSAPVASTSRVKLDHAPTAPPFRLSRAQRDVAFGSIAGMISKVFEHPFDLVKVRLQTQPSGQKPPMYSGAFDCFRQTYVKEGVRGLYRGLSMPVFGATLENACLFFTYNFVQGQLRKMAGLQTASTSSLEEDAERPMPMTYLGIAAACAGVSASLVLTPVELIKCKMQVQMVAKEAEVLAAATSAAGGKGQGAKSGPRPGPARGTFAVGQRNASTAAISTSSSATREQVNRALSTLDGPAVILRKILREDGIRGLWLGQTGTLLRETGGGIAWFLAFEQSTRALIKARQSKNSSSADVITKKDLSSAELIGAGALAGISYNVILFPADSVKSTMQTEREWAASRAGSGGASAAFQPKGFVATFLDLYLTRGVRGLYAGCGVTCMRSAPSSAIIFLLYNRLEGLADDFGI